MDEQTLGSGVSGTTANRNRRQPRTAGARAPLAHDLKVFVLCLAAGAPAVLVSLVMLWQGEFTEKVQWTLSVVVVGTWLGVAVAVRERVVVPLQTLSNLLAALREGDYSIRARGASFDEPLGQLILEANALGETLHAQRLGALEATHLLRTVMREIDVAIFTFSDNERLQLVNRAGEQLLARSQERLLERTAAELGLADCLSGGAERTLQRVFPGKSGRFGLHRASFREGGRQHQMVALSDLSQALREEERLAWRRLIRVIGHELNNSLAPIKSMAGTMEQLLGKDPESVDWQVDMKSGLKVIQDRSESLSRFMGAYARLARLPSPVFRKVRVRTVVDHVRTLATAEDVAVVEGPDREIVADADQLEQALINLVRNAVEAVHPSSGAVELSWSFTGRDVKLFVSDEGPGLANTANLFVPFFTTKAGGSGIGLVLSRQIAEAHGGDLELSNRVDREGCLAVLTIPCHQETGLH